MLTRVRSQTQLVFASFIRNTKEAVLSISCVSARVFKIHSKPASIVCEAVNLI